MKNKQLYFVIFIAIAISFTNCKKSFLEDIKSYDKYDEKTAFTNEILTGAYIDRIYNYYFASYRSPIQAEATLGAFDDSKTRQTEEIGGTVSNYINPNRTLQAATEADGYYGPLLASSGFANTPYSRIRLANFLLDNIDEIGGSALSQTFRNTSKGQAYYFRALQLFNLVRTYGGVPIVLHVQQGSSTDTSIRIPRATATECFAQIARDFDSAAALLPAIWPATGYGRFTSVAALAMKSRALLTAASPLFNADWDNTGNAKWQAALQAGLAAETAATSAGYGLYGANAKQWGEMTTAQDNSFNKEAIFPLLFSSTITSTTGYNNGWENTIRPRDYNGGGGISAPKDMLDLFPLADGRRPTLANGYVDTFFFENRDPRFYRTFAFSGEKWGTGGNGGNLNRTTFFYRWKTATTGTIAINYYGYNSGNQNTTPAVVRKMSNSNADTSALAFSGTDVFEYRYAELLLNIAECYAATGNTANCLTYLGKIRARVGIPSANNYGIGVLADKYAAIEASLYERRVELAYEGKRFWDIHRWLLYDGVSSMNTATNTCTKLRLTPINGTSRKGFYWQTLAISPNVGGKPVDPLTAADKNILIDPDASNFVTQIAALKALYKAKFIVTPLDQVLDRDGTNAVNILFRPNYYLSGLNGTVLSYNPWIKQTIGWLDYSGAPGDFNSAQ